MSAPPGSRTRTLLVAVGLTFTLAGAALWITRPDRSASEGAGSQAAEATVAVLEVVEQRLPDRLEESGVLLARREVELSTESEGRVVEVGAEALDVVEAGQVLLRLDETRATLALARAQAVLDQRESEHVLAQANRERRRSLAARDAASRVLLDEAESAARVAEAALRQARVALEEARDERAKKTLRAVFSGVLRRFDAEVGEVVPRGRILGELLDLSTVRARLGVTDRQVPALHPGMPVEARVEAFPNEAFPGEILRVGLAADPATKKFPVEIEIPNPGGRLRPGMVLRATVDLEPARPRLVIPRDAAFEAFGIWSVAVVGAPDARGRARIERRRIEVRDLAFRPGELEVVRGLEPGERIVVSGAREVRPGETVRIAPGPGA